MRVERAPIAVENLIANHVAASFRWQDRAGSAEGMAARIRSRITDRFQLGKIRSEQDNTPRTVRTLRSRFITVFTPAQQPRTPGDRTEQLALLKASLEAFRHRRTPTSSERPGNQPHNPLPADLMLERQQLVLKNEFTQGFGRIETWLISLAALALVLLNAIDIPWMLPILALGIGRAWYLDHRCRKRLARIAEIDANVEPAL